MHKLLIQSFIALSLLASCNTGFAQVYGIEFHNAVMPASGAMGGTSFALPQDIQSAINGNPSTTTQFPGTQFSFSGSLAEVTYDVDQTRRLLSLGVQPFQGKSNSPTALFGNIGVTTQSEFLGMPTVLGVALITNSAIGVDFRPITESNGTHYFYAGLDAVGSMAMKLTPNFSVGTTIGVGGSLMDGPFVGDGSSQVDYSPRFSVGANYELGGGTTIGGFWQSKKSFNFEDLVRFPGGNFLDVAFQHPTNVGFGIANDCLMNGRLLLATDVLYKNYSDADFFRAIFHDQWAFQFGGQYLVGPRLRLRIGYTYVEDPTLAKVPGTIGGIIPIGGIPAVEYVQGQFASINEHRLSGGFGIRDLRPGMDLDVAVGGAFKDSATFGSTTASIESYWLTFGFTWRIPAQTQDRTLETL